MDITFRNIDSAFIDAVMEVPMEDGKFFPFSPVHLTFFEESQRLYLPLETERSEAGKGLVRALWFDKPVYLWAEHQRYTLKPHRCHIVGNIFTSHYLQAKQRDPMSEVSAVWELVIIACEDMNITPPSPQMLHLSGLREIHLDHPSLH